MILPATIFPYFSYKPHFKDDFPSELKAHVSWRFRHSSFSWSFTLSVTSLSSSQIAQWIGLLKVKAPNNWLVKPCF
jgi:hypothetical protein